MDYNTEPAILFPTPQFPRVPERDDPTSLPPVPNGFSRRIDEDIEESRTVPLKERTGIDTRPPIGFGPNPNDLTENMENLLRISPDPANDLAKIRASIDIGDALGVPHQDVFNNFDLYTQEYFGAKESPQKVSEYLGDAAKRGVMAVGTGHKAIDLMIHPNVESFHDLVDYMEGIPPIRNMDQKWITRMLGDSVNLAGTMGSALLAGFVSSRAASILGPEAAAIGFKGGTMSEAFMVAGGGIYADIVTMKHPETGEYMYDYLFNHPGNMRVNPETGEMEPIKDLEEIQSAFLNKAALFATGGGAVSALLETFQLGLATNKITKTVVNRNLSKIAEKALGEGFLKNIAGRFFVNYASNYAEEVGSEMVQEAAEFWAGELGRRDIAKQLEIEGVPRADIEAFMTHMNSVFKSVSNGMLLMPIPGAFVSAAESTLKVAQQRRSTPNLQWQDSTERATASDIQSTTAPSAEQVNRANQGIKTLEPQAPIRVIENADGQLEVDPSDAARLEAYKTRKIENVPITRTNWQAAVEENMTPQRLAQMNGFKIFNGKVVVPNATTLQRLIESNPETFTKTENGVQMIDPETQEVVGIQSEANAAIEDSGLWDALRDVESKVEQMPEHLQEVIKDLIDDVRKAEREGNLYDLRKALKNDEFLKEDSLNWLSENFSKETNNLEQAISDVENISDELITERSTASPDFQEATVPLLKDVQEQRIKYRQLQTERIPFSKNMLAMTDANVQKLAAIDAEMAALEQYMPDVREKAVEEATRMGVPVKDDILEQYNDRDWAKEEIAKREILRSDESIYHEAATYMGRVDEFENYITSDFFWPDDNESKKRFFESLPEDPELRKDYLQDIIDRSYFKSERNLEFFVESIQTDEGLSSWLHKMARVMSRSGLTNRVKESITDKNILFSVTNLANGKLEATPQRLQLIREELSKNAGYWQPIFYELLAEVEPELGRAWQAQKDYEYLTSIDKDNNLSAIDMPPPEFTRDQHSAMKKYWDNLKKFQEMGHSEETDMYRDKKEVQARKRSIARFKRLARAQLGDADFDREFKRFKKEYVKKGRVYAYKRAKSTKAQSKAKIKNAIETQIRETAGTLENIGDKELDGFFEISKKIAKYRGMDLETWLDSAFVEKAFVVDTIALEKEGARGAARTGIFDGKVKSQIALSEKAGVETLIHELTHVMRNWLKDEDIRALEEQYGGMFQNVRNVAEGKEVVTEEQSQIEEDFVADFMIYISEGKAPSKEVEGIFALVKDVLKTVMSYLFGENGEHAYEIQGASRDVFEKILGPEIEATTEILNEETTEQGLEKKVSATDTKIQALKETIASARQEARLQAQEVKDAERALNEEKQKDRDEMWQKRVDDRQEKLDNERQRAKDLRDKMARLRAEHRAEQRIKAQAIRIKEKKKKHAKSIMKPAASGINVRVRDKIETLQGLLDPEFRSKANTEAWLKEFKEIVRKYEDEGLEALVTKYNMRPRPLNLWTIDELKPLNDFIDGLRKDGKTFQDELDNQLRAHYRQTRELYVQSIADAPPLPPAGTAEGRKARRSGVLQNVAFWTWRPSRIFRYLDSWTEGNLYNYFITEVNEKTDIALRETRVRRDRGKAYREELNLTVHDLSKKTQVIEKTFTRDEMIHIWLATKNEKSMLALLNGNKLSEAEITKVESLLTKEEKLWGQFMMDDFTENYIRLADVYEIYANDHMGKEQAYFPMLREGASWESQDEEFWDQFKLRKEYQQSYVDRHFTMARKENTSKQQAGIKLGATHIWSEQVEKHEYWIAMGMHVKGMNGIVGRWQFKDPFISKFGMSGYNFMKKYITDVSNPTMFRAQDGISQLSRMLRKNAAIAYLSYNLLTMAKQVPSIALFMKEVGPLRLVAAAAKYTAEHNKWKAYINARDPQMMERVVTKEIELIREQEKGAYSRTVSKIGETGMKGITSFDSLVTHIGWLAVYDKYAHTLGEAEAVRKAQITVLETQPSARAKDLSQIYRSGETLNWFTMFSNQLNNIWNMSTADSIYLWKQHEYGKLMGSVIGVGISTLSMMLLAGWRPGGDDDKFGVEYFKSAVNMVPLLGKGVSAGASGWGAGGVEPVPIGGEVGRVFSEAVDLDGEGLAKAVYDMALAAGVSAGIPTTGLVRRPVKAIKERDVKELLGPAFGD